MTYWKDHLDESMRGGSRYLAWKEVAQTTGLSRTTAWRLQKRDEFPAPYIISPGRVGYREDEVEAWRVSRDHRGPLARACSAPSRRDRSGINQHPATGVSVEGAATVLLAPVPSPQPPASPAVPPSAPAPTPSIASSATRAVPRQARGRRRSEHARAIAQQIMFDF